VDFCCTTNRKGNQATSKSYRIILQIADLLVFVSNNPKERGHLEDIIIDNTEMDIKGTG
jgi:hypothetical protein